MLAATSFNQTSYIYTAMPTIMKKSDLICITGLLLVVLLSCNKTKTACSNSLESGSCSDNAVEIDSSKAHRKVLIIGIDAFRSEAMQQKICPFMYELSEKSTTYYTDKHDIEDHTISGPNWSSLLTGVHWCKHNVTGNDFQDNHLNEFPPLFYYIESAMPSMNTVSIVNWRPINDHLASSYGDHCPTESIGDAEVFQQVQDALEDQDPIDPDILFLHFDAPDAAGHNSGFSSKKEEYANALTTIDGYVSDLFSIIETKRSNGEEWMVFIVSDHGGNNKKHGKGQKNDHISKTIFYACSPDVDFTGIQTTSQVDLAPTVLHYLGITSSRFNCRTDGVSLIY